MSLPKSLAVATLAPLLYLCGCALLAASVAYPLFELLGKGDSGAFRDLVSRGGQVFLLLGLFLFARRRGYGAAELGFYRGLPRQWVIGFGIGVLILGLHVLNLLALDVRALNGGGPPPLAKLASILGSALGIGLGVALVEEIIFRGVLFAALRAQAGVIAAVLISAFYYAGLHFLRSRWDGDPAEIGWRTGFTIAADAFTRLAQAPLDSFLALFLAGVLLGCVRAALPRGLGYCMGLHAGWVFVIKAAKPLTHLVPDQPLGFLVGAYDRIIGYLSAAWIALLIALFLFAVARRRRAPGRVPPA